MVFFIVAFLQDEAGAQLLRARLQPVGRLNINMNRLVVVVELVMSSTSKAPHIITQGALSCNERAHEIPPILRCSIISLSYIWSLLRIILISFTGRRTVSLTHIRSP